ncbi:MAG: DUF1957 domain-containing protein [Treponema sp.]|nr:DUF1957 domain-containing protein [Treponema sp.]
MTKKLVFIIKANQEFIRHPKGEFVEVEPETNSLFENITDIYIPLLSLLEKYEQEQKKVTIGLVLPPVLCAMLENQELQNMYVSWLDLRIALGEKEIVRCASNPQLLKIAEKTLENYKEKKSLFIEKYEQKLIPAFALFHKKGYLELLGTTGTDVFLPHYQDMTEVISAQIETGLQAYRKSFGDFPEGFWIPELGFTPGIEKLVKAFGYSYTVLDARSVLLSSTLPSKGIFYPGRTENSLAVFTADPLLQDEIFDEEGFCNNEAYRNESRDIGFELAAADLQPVVVSGGARISTGYKYWSDSFDEDDDLIYDMDKAFEQVKKDAVTFLNEKGELLTKAAEATNAQDYVTLVCPLDAEKLSKNWGEWLKWLELVIDNSAAYGLEISSCNSMLDKQYTYEKILPYYSSWNGAGYGETLLSSKNSWMMRYIRKACERMIDLADRFPTDTGLKTRLLNLGAKELLIAQSLGLAKMIENDDNPEFAKRRFEDSINAFTDVFDSLGSNTVSTEWLTTLEIYDDVFPWMNYRIFSKKK